MERKRRGKKIIFILEILDKKVLSYQEKKKYVKSLLKETLIN